jgi:holo-[acyl-carrier protein] synthase
VTVVGIGIDLVDVERFGALLARRSGMATRLFTEAERASAAGAVHRLAARFAAKEALLKALGAGLGAFAFHDAEVSTLASGQPVLALRRRAAELSAAQGVQTVHLTMSHTAHTAGAVVVLSA